MSETTASGGATAIRDGGSALALRGLALTVPERTLLSGLEVELRPGECWALLGRNGSGKTSLLLAAAGLRTPARGTVTIDGDRLEALDRRTIARHVGILLQEEPEVYWGSVADYVTLGGHAHAGAGRARDAGVQEALAAVDLVDRAAQPYRTLSGGERQRARLAQLLVQSPRYLLLDEPLTHLDLRHQLATMALLARLAAQGHGVMMALHEPWLAARYCDRALLLYDSARFSIGPVARLLAREPLERLYGCPLEAFADGRVLAASPFDRP
jgi:iron complex transport system ATP-binding protein